ncbi:uncharacterized protein LOC119112435 [Pollicipes pollicipes]|uniref:uncharacterized protein LOC119112435 n=1 Tax=Pollicipes pollicipes TaxID=41117 RepID=UPI00188565E6|nr:uncharacterized protein LOC119112435 [Pollicipes pollicipes]
MRWLWTIALLLCLLTCLGASSRPRHGRRAMLGPHVHTLARAALRRRRQHQPRGEVANSRVSAVARGGPKKSKLSKKAYLTMLKKQRGFKDKSAKARLRSTKEICLFKALKRCGRKVIKKMASSPDFNKRCTTKERFLDCMSLRQRRGCKARGRRRHGPSRRLVQQYRRRLQRLLSSTRGCVIGVDLSATAGR